MIVREFGLTSKHVDPRDQAHASERKRQSSAIPRWVIAGYFWGAPRTTRVPMANRKPANDAKAPDEFCPEQSHLVCHEGCFHTISDHRDFVHLPVRACDLLRCSASSNALHHARSRSADQ